ncbi:MAG: hypothetical protein BGO70_11530 [Bacteroidetes bacterium 43-93]|nr:hypothetical protein [Bacteroidota bacterium]OJW98095.1 MAG: hypothetical protein BGO70_11530 [Bacteroidetes bacterium 43-93]
MKFLLLPLTALLIFSACKKDYNCTCKATATIPGLASVDSTYVIKLTKQKKKDAEKTCSANNASASVTDPSSGFSYTESVNCTLN